MNTEKTSSLIGKMPKKIITGTRIQWTVKGLDDYKDDEWKISYYLKNYTDSIIIPCTWQGEIWQVLLEVDESLDWNPGRYWWQLIASSEMDNKMIAGGEVTLEKSFMELEKYDARCHAEKVLDALEKLIEGKASKDQMSYSIAGRNICRLSPSELLNWRDKYRAEIITLQKQNGIRSDQTIKVRF